MKTLFRLVALQCLALVAVSGLYASSINSFIDGVNPKQNAVSVIRSSDIHIVFTQDMNAATITGSNIKVFGMMTGLMPASFSYDAVSKTATVNPNNNFKTGEIISVTLTSGIQTSLSINLEPFVYTFTVQSSGGSGMFTESSVVDSTASIFSVYSYAAGDLDGDGDIDIVLSVEGGVKIYKNNGAASFTYASTLPVAGKSSVGDFNNDGFQDILVKNESLYLYTNDGLGNFTLSNVSNGGVGKIADLDGNGFLDVVSDSSFSSIIIVRNNSGTFNQDSTYVLPPIKDVLVTNYDMDYTINDFNNDGKPDIAESHRVGSESFEIWSWHRVGYILENMGLSKFNSDSIYSDMPGGAVASLGESKITSFNSKNNDNNNLYYSRVKFTNDGNGNFVNDVFPEYYFSILPGDFNGDGKIDLVSVTINDNKVRFFKNDGNGNFTQYVNDYLVNQIPLLSADLDNDGDLDLISFNNTKFTVLLNNDCIHPVIDLTGNTTISTGTSSNLYSASLSGGNWELINTPPCSAFISGTGSDDTVRVNSGPVTGRFTLYYNLDDSCGVTTNRIFVSVDNPSPVELSSFTSTINSRNVTLNWTTTMEENNSGFDIERSVQNNNNWSKISFVAGTGNSNNPVNYSYEDKNLNSGKYNYRLKQTDFNGNFKYYNLSNEVVIGVPQKYSLSQNYPNPFNPVTNLEFGISDLGFVSLKVFDASGKEVITLVNEIKQPGYYTAIFDGSNFSSGVYFYRIEAGSFIQTKKMLLLK